MKLKRDWYDYLMIFLNIIMIWLVVRGVMLQLRQIQSSMDETKEEYASHTSAIIKGLEDVQLATDMSIQREQSISKSAIRNTEIALKEVDSLRLAIQEQQKHTEELSEKYSEMTQKYQAVEARYRETEESLARLKAEFSASPYELKASEGRYEVRGKFKGKKRKK